MSTHRFRQKAQTCQDTLREHIDPALTVDGSVSQSETDITLADDAYLDDLKYLMGLCGYEFVSTAPASPLQNDYTSPDMNKWGLRITNRGNFVQVDPSGNEIEHAVVKTGKESTSGAVTKTVVEIPVPDDYFGSLAVELSGEHVGTPADCYCWQKWIAVSAAAGAATIRDASLVPTIMNPSAKAIAVTVDTNGQNVRLRVTGIAAEDWKFVGRLGLMSRER